MKSNDHLSKNRNGTSSVSVLKFILLGTSVSLVVVNYISAFATGTCTLFATIATVASCTSQPSWKLKWMYCASSVRFVSSVTSLSESVPKSSTLTPVLASKASVIPTMIRSHNKAWCDVTIKEALQGYRRGAHGREDSDAPPEPRQGVPGNDVFYDFFLSDRTLREVVRRKSRHLLDMVRHVCAGDSCLRRDTRGGFLHDKGVDRLSKLLSFVLVGVATFQTLGRIISRQDYALVDEVAGKMLSQESAKALKSVVQIIKRFDDHGVIDVFSKYPTKDVVASILALSRLQRASSAVDHAEQRQVTEDNIPDTRLLNDLAHYSVFANSAYGWKGGLALSGRLHMGNMNTVIARTGVHESDVLMARWRSQTHRPAFFLVRDQERKKLVLCVRGTLSAKDVLTDLCATADDFVSESCTGASSGFSVLKQKLGANYRARAHHGMVAGAKGVAQEARETVEQELSSSPEYELVIVGHSLGGGTAAVLGTLWKDVFPGLSVYAYGCPCVGPIDSNPTRNDAIISVVGEGDPFSNLSLGHLADITCALSQLCEDHSLRSDVLCRTRKKVQTMSEEDLQWCSQKMQELRKRMTGEKFYPPGRIMHMEGANFGNGNVTLREVARWKFRDLTLHPFMFDLSRHVPNRYESALRRLWKDASDGNRTKTEGTQFCKLNKNREICKIRK